MKLSAVGHQTGHVPFHSENSMWTYCFLTQCHFFTQHIHSHKQGEVYKPDELFPVTDQGSIKW